MALVESATFGSTVPGEVNSPAYNSFLGLLSRNKPEDALAMRDEILAVLGSPGWAFVKDLLDGRVAEIRRLMENGLHQQAEYAVMAGEIRGLTAIKDAVGAISEASDRAELALEQAVGLSAGSES